jgi:DUF1680 family protein
VELRQKTSYPFDGGIRIAVAPEQTARFAIDVRIPSWAVNASIHINGSPIPRATEAGAYVRLDREWKTGDEIALDLPMQPTLHHRVHRNVQESRAPDGSPVSQEVLCYEYVGVTRGPLVYATGLIDGYKTGETVRIPSAPSHQWLEVLPVKAGEEGPGIRMKPEGRSELVFWPYYRAGGRENGAWRVTWLSLAPGVPPLM